MAPEASSAHQKWTLSPASRIQSQVFRSTTRGNAPDAMGVLDVRGPSIVWSPAPTLS